MMKYDVVLGHQLTIGLHLSYTTPMNCDFDGDENNVWSFQDFEVEAEAEVLMAVENNIMSSEQNRPMMGLVMNGISGSYLLTKEGVRINDRLFEELTQMITHPEDLDTLYGRLIKYGVHPRDGKAAFSATLPPDFYYNQKGVIIFEGVVLEGRLTKAHVGTSNRSIIQDMHKRPNDNRARRTADFFTDAPWIVNKWLTERGFSVGLLDCINLDIDERTGEEYDRNKRILGQELAKIYVELEAKSVKLDDPIEESFRQRQINEIVNISTGIGLRLVDEVLDKDNSIGVMTEKGSGSKGANANVGQMMGSVGQQFLYGERLKPTLTGGRRLLPIYDVDDPDPEAHAFIPESFYTGVSPQGLFFLLAGGRPNILDTALKTADTGSMQHRMIKAFENIIIGYDGSIRNTIGTMFAPMYNAGYDVAEMIAVEQPGKPQFSSFIDIKNLMAEINVAGGWVPLELERRIYARRQELLRNGLPPENILPVQDPVRTPPVPAVAITYDINTPVVPAEPIFRITKFEKARILGTRAMQLSHNAPPLLEIGDEIDPVRIAMREYDAGILPIYVVRRFPDGSIQTVYPTLDTI
jgi:DNA-directed RNA polymerase II subunit RPB1